MPLDDNTDIDDIINELARPVANTISADPDLLNAACAQMRPSELGNAQRLEARFGSVLRHSPAGWVSYDGKAWRRGAAGIAQELAKRVVIALEDEHDTLPVERREAFRRHIRASEKRAAIVSMLALASSSLDVEESAFDRAPALINAQNATVDLSTGEARAHDPADYLTGLAPVAFTPAAPRPVWDQFIIDICRDSRMNRDEDKEKFLKVALGYSLFAHNKRALCFILTGDDRNDDRNGRNGKSALFNAVSAACGAEYVRRFERKMLVRSNGKAPDAVDRLPLIGARIAFCSELNGSDILDTGALKEITGEQATFARSLHNDAIEIRTTATPWIGTNFLPRFSSTETAVWDRVRRIRLCNYFYAPDSVPADGHGQPQDPQLAEKLAAEAEGIFAWLVEGAAEYALNGFPELEEARGSLTKTRDDNDTLLGFIDACLIREEGSRTKAKDVFDAYAGYCEQNGIEPLSLRAFGDALNGKGFEGKKVGSFVFRLDCRLNLAGRACKDGITVESALGFDLIDESGNRTPAADADISLINLFGDTVCENDDVLAADGKRYRVGRKCQPQPYENVIQLKGRRK